MALSEAMVRKAGGNFTLESNIILNLSGLGGTGKNITSIETNIGVILTFYDAHRYKPPGRFTQGL